MTRFASKSQLVSGGQQVGGNQFPGWHQDEEPPQHHVPLESPVTPAPSDAHDRAFGHYADPPETHTETKVDDKSIENKSTAKSGGTEQTSSTSLGKDGPTFTQTTKSSSGDSSTETKTSVNTGKDGPGVTVSNTQQDGDQEKTAGASVAIDPSKDTTTIGGNYAQNGSGGNVSLIVGNKGIQGGSLGGDLKAGPVTAGGSVTLDQDTQKLDAHAKVAGISGALTYEVEHHDDDPKFVRKEDDAKDKDPVINDMVGGGSYVVTTRSDSTKLGGSLGAGALEVAGDMSSGSSLQFFQKLPSDWSTMSPNHRALWKEDTMAAQKTEMGKTEGLADIDLEHMPDGAGLRFTTFNGWNAKAGVSYGAVSLGGGGGQSSASDVTMMREGKNIEISLSRKDGFTGNMSMALASFGVNMEQTSADTHGVKFTVDITNKDAVTAMKTFMTTGLLPGADHLKDPNAQKATASFNTARDDVDKLNDDIKKLQAQIPQGVGPADPSVANIADQLKDKYKALDAAQTTLAVNRNYLNDEWQREHGTQLAKDDSMPWLTMETITDVHQQTTKTGGTSLAGDVELGRDEQTWVHQQHWSKEHTAQDRYGFDDKAYFLNHKTSEQSGQFDTDQDDVVLRMHSDNTQFTPETATIIKDIKQSNLPQYVIDGYVQHSMWMPWEHPVYENMSGQTDIQLTAQQFNAMTTSMNDMNNADSKALWGDFAQRTSTFLAGTDMVVKTGQGFDDQAERGQELARRQWIDTLLARDPQKDPLRLALAKYDDKDMNNALQKASAEFANVKTPADFQKLPIEQQQLYIAVIQQTSGVDHDLSGTRNKYDAIAAIALLHDPTSPDNDAKLRADTMCNLFAEANQDAKDDYSDGVWSFVKFTERFKNDPATYALIQKGMSFHWDQPEIEDIAKNQSPQQIAQQFGNAYGGGRDDGKMFTLLQAANTRGGTTEVADLVKASGADPKQILQRLSGDPLRQHMAYDLLVQSGLGAQLADVQLSFK